MTLKTAKKIINKLSEIFNVSAPNVHYGTIGRKNVVGLYFQPKPEKTYYRDVARTKTITLPAQKAYLLIERNSRDKLGTLLHEFAHHIEFGHDLEHQEPPIYLSQVETEYKKNYASPAIECR